jgi:hypothetical protein
MRKEIRILYKPDFLQHSDSLDSRLLTPKSRRDFKGEALASRLYRPAANRPLR